MGDERPKFKALCPRCEHRAEAHELGSSPRYECGDFERTVSSCYMFQPCKLLKLKKSDKADKRPMCGPPLISSRVRAVEVVKGNMVLESGKDGTVMYWTPLKKKKKA